MNTLLLQQKAIKTSFENVQKELAKETKKSLALENQLNLSIKKAGFETISSLKAAFLSSEEEKSITQQSELLKEKIIENTQSLKTLKEDLVEVQKTKWDDLDMEKIRQDLFEKEEALTKFQQLIGAIDQQLKDNKARENNAKELVGKIDRQQKETNRCYWYDDCYD